MAADPSIAGLPAVSPVLVVGLGITGLSCARYFARLGQPVRIVDSRESPPGLEGLADVQGEVEVRLGGLPPEALEDVSEVVLSPGVRADEPLVVEAHRRRIPVAGDIELFARAAPAPIAAITGSNGKSTVTTLVAELVGAGGLSVRSGGNLGPAALDLLEGDPPDCFVLELSSFQLETTDSLRPRAATVLNLSPDHIDRHGSFERYAAAKARIFRGAETAVLNRQDPGVMAMAPKGCRQITFGLDAPAGENYGVVGEGEAAWLARGAERLARVGDLRLRGRHNVANALAALALAEAMGVRPASVVDALCRFGGLAHRTQWVADVAGVTFIDDSKGTNVGASVAAISGMAGPVVLIAGGDCKGADFAPLAAAARGRVKAAVLMGRDAPMVARALSGVCEVRRAASMDEAVAEAARVAGPGDTVLLSPACASTDMFRDYTWRGRAFAEAVARLAS